MALLPYIAIGITGVTGYLLVKRYQTHMVLLLSGLFMVALAVLFGVTNILPGKMPSSGLVWFDIIDLLRSIATRQSSGIGFLIMVAGGFAAYMSQIGASDVLVRISSRPLKAFHQPYLVLSLAYLLGQFLVTVIPSAAGLAMLLLVVVFPMLTAVGVSPASAAAVIGTSAGMTLGPASGTAILAAKVAQIEPIIYFVKYQLPVAIPTLIAVAVMHFFVQRHYDLKGGDIYETPKEVKVQELKDAPLWYALFPLLPIVLLIVFSRLVHETIRLDTVSALLLVWVFAVVSELVRWRDPKKVFADAMTLFKSMGTMFATIVSLIIAAEMFAAGLKTTGLISLLIDSARTAGFGMSGMTMVLTAIVGAVTLLTGSGVGAYSSFATLAPTVASGLGGSIEALVTPMQFGSGMFRAMSPVAGVIIAVAGAAGISPIAVVRRTMLPMGVGIVVMVSASFLFL
ncbi:C4-dicarboxylate transporter DcuC [Oleispirillum naphthae]|uniref:C4-dicarboxylate transporter DcuC n=1 Tax=Oleispirillum naphthae TaxID=2838853 RepID=UPI0030825273